MNNTQLERELIKDINDYKYKIEHRDFLNVRNKIIRFLLRTGLIMDRAVPFYLAAFLTLNSSAFKNNKPFKIDNIDKPVYIKTIDTANGHHFEVICPYGSSYIDKIEYSTGWYNNDRGLYERTIVQYEFNSDYVEDIINMTKEEIDNLLSITDVRTVSKNYLDDEDLIYDSDTVVITRYEKSNDIKLPVAETQSENIWNSSLYVAITFFCAMGFKNVKKIIIKNVIQDKINLGLCKYRYISEQEIEEMKEIIKIKEENLKLIKPDDTSKKRVLCKITGGKN